ncbi:MAG: acylglycerol kinase family protein, partial [Promethearchaeia archaeon]
MVAHAEDLLEWSCRFCRVGVGQVHRCTAVVGPTYLQIRWWTFPSPIQRERKLEAHNVLRASISHEPRLRVTVHVLTTPDANGDSEYKTYEFTDFANDEDSETFAAAVNAIAFSERPLPSDKRVLVFVNPISGSRSGPKRFRAIEPLFRLVGLECEVITTTHHGHAAEVIATANLDQYSAVLSVS